MQKFMNSVHDRHNKINDLRAKIAARKLEWLQLREQLKEKKTPAEEYRELYLNDKRPSLRVIITDLLRQKLIAAKDKK